MATVHMEDRYQILKNSKIVKLRTVSPWSRNCCIFRVPAVLRRLNEKAYEPDIVAIGPYHRNKRSLRHMEDVKNWYLHDLLSRMNVSLRSLIDGIRESEARACYQEQFDDEFMEIMILDGCFLVEFFRKQNDSNLRSSDDPIFNMTCMQQYLVHDLLLLENQLPWFILQKLFDRTKPNDQTNLFLIDLVLEFFWPYISTDTNYVARPPSGRKHLHILSLIRDELVSSRPGTDQTGSSTSDDNDNFTTPPSDIENLTRDELVSSRPGTDQTESSTSNDNEKFMIPCVTRLLEAGVKFKKGSGGIMNINFTNGNFEIPPLLILETTETMFRNLIAFEQCYRNCETKITSYAVLMDSLINTGKDVEYLVDNGIIVDWLSAEDASQSLNKLYNDTHLPKFYYAELVKSVNEHYGRKWNRWRATLMRQYFTSPWSVISLIGAIILLVLTFLQTFYSIKQSYF